MSLLQRIVLFAFCVLSVWGWEPSSAHAQVVQLPSFEVFSYSGSVLVPDRGTASLGGVSRSASSSFGGRSGRGFGQSSSRSNASVSATIIDLDAMDREIRGVNSKNLARVPADVPDRKREWTQLDYAKGFVRLARRQRKSGNDGAAFKSYTTAISLLRGELRDYASREFRRYYGAAAQQSIAALR